MEQRRGLLTDEVNAGRVVDVLDHVPADALRPILLLRESTSHDQLFFYCNTVKY